MEGHPRYLFSGTEKHRLDWELTYVLSSRKMRENVHGGQYKWTQQSLQSLASNHPTDRRQPELKVLVNDCLLLKFNTVMSDGSQPKERGIHLFNGISK